MNAKRWKEKKDMKTFQPTNHRLLQKVTQSMKTERLRDESDDMGGSRTARRTTRMRTTAQPTVSSLSLSLSLSLSTSSLTLLSVWLPNKLYFQTHMVKTINFSFLLFFPIHGFIFQLLIHSKFFQFCSLFWRPHTSFSFLGFSQF